MKKIKIIIGFIVMTINLLIVIPAFADINDFYYKDFTGDYFVSKDNEGISRMKVRESLTAVFPNFMQNKGICRWIPFTNQDGGNLVLPTLSWSDIRLTRNGITEPIYSIEREKDFYSVCTGTDDYILGEQTYVFEYEFTKVITEFDIDGQKIQELYWDANGNGFLQGFNSVKARVHFENSEILTDNNKCFVGKYGEDGQNRCTITKISDGLEFSAKGLTPYESLTFYIEVKAGSFVVPGPEENYFYIIAIIITGGFCLLSILLAIRKYLNFREKAKQYKSIFVKPEYQPNDKYSLPEMTEIYLGKKKDVKVGMLLELIVKKKIELRKSRKWSFVVKDLDGVRQEYIDLLSILNDGMPVKINDEIKIERHTASGRLINLKKSMDKKIANDLWGDGLVEKDYKLGNIREIKIVNIIATSIIFSLIIWILWIFIVDFIYDVMLDNGFTGKMVFSEESSFISIPIFFVTTFVCILFFSLSTRYKWHTLKGMEASRYMEGLKLYIEMAETERIKMLQSLKGVSTSADGIVKIYEKLLPYAAIFGLEESWINEMKKYCEVSNIEEPDYLLVGFAVHDIVRSVHNASSYITASSVMANSGGSFSSGFSGGGGGGFSGGGGGGGGGCGR